MADRNSELRDYYASLGGSGGVARQSGWRRRIGQLARFEMALAPWDGAGVRSVVDLGCGTGELAGYLRATGRELEYVGIDVRSDAIECARERHGADRFVCGDIFSIDLKSAAELAVAIGTHVDGRVPSSESDRRERIRSVVERTGEAARCGISCVLTDAESVAGTAAVDSDPALFGVRAGEFEERAEAMEGPAVVADSPIGRDRILLGAIDAGGTEPGEPSPEEALERVVGAHRRLGGEETEVAWLWLEAGAWERARAVLEGLDGLGSRYRHLVRRLRRRL